MKQLAHLLNPLLIHVGSVLTTTTSAKGTFHAEVFTVRGVPHHIMVTTLNNGQFEVCGVASCPYGGDLLKYHGHGQAVAAQDLSKTVTDKIELLSGQTVSDLFASTDTSWDTRNLREGRAIVALHYVQTLIAPEAAGNVRTWLNTAFKAMGLKFKRAYSNVSSNGVLLGKTLKYYGLSTDLRTVTVFALLQELNRKLAHLNVKVVYELDSKGKEAQVRIVAC